VALRSDILAGLLIVGSLAYLAVGLAPYSFDFTRPSKVHLVYLTPWNGALNFVCFLPLGFLIGRMPFVGNPLLAAFCVCGSMSLTVEAAQLFLPGRFCCASDWVLNTLGAIAGAWLAGYWWTNA